jgi:tripartite-type tricarboxylate transporter receptor subunit TctC
MHKPIQNDTAMKKICYVTAFLSSFLIPLGAMAQIGPQKWPTKPVRLVVAYAPGGFTDQSARLIAIRLSELWGQAVIVDNRAGASGNIGTQLVAKAKPDGYTLLAAFDSNIVINSTLYAGKLNFDPIHDLVPITKVTQVANAIAVHPSFAPRTCQEFLTAARSQKPAFSYASPGIGTTGHMAAELLQQLANVSLVSIPYKGGGQAVIDVISGQVPMIFTSLPTVRPFAEQGKLRLLAVTSANRVRGLDVPTLQECGLAGVDVSSWVGVMAPTGTPSAIITQIATDVRRAMSGDDTKLQVEKMGADLVLNTPAQFGEQIRSESERWARVIHLNNVKSN